MVSILFVCLGNICRSPLADGIANSIVKENSLNIEIDSAGTGDWHVGEAPCKNSIMVAKKHDIDISHLRARKIQKSDIDNFNLIVALDESNYNDLKLMGVENLVKLGNYGFNGDDIPDPYFFDGYDGFEKVYEMIEVCINNLFSIEYPK